MKHKPEPATGSRLPRTIGMLAVRYGIGAVMIAGGIVTLAVSPAGLGVDGFAMALGGGISVILINLLYRLSVSGEQDREREERARAYLQEHGEWPPDEPPLQPRRGRKRALAPGVVALDDELAQQAAGAGIDPRPPTAPGRSSTAATPANWSASSQHPVRRDHAPAG